MRAHHHRRCKARRARWTWRRGEGAGPDAAGTGMSQRHGACLPDPECLRWFVSFRLCSSNVSEGLSHLPGPSDAGLSGIVDDRGHNRYARAQPRRERCGAGCGVKRADYGTKNRTRQPVCMFLVLPLSEAATHWPRLSFLSVPSNPTSSDGPSALQRPQCTPSLLSNPRAI